MYAFVNERKGGLGMKVSIELSPEYRIPYAVIYADKITDEIQKIMESFSRQETPITALQNEENLVVLQPEEIYMVRVEAGDTILLGSVQNIVPERDFMN